MTKSKLFLSVLLSFVLFVVSYPNVYAQGFEKAISEEIVHAEEDHVDDASVTPRFTCHYCYGEAVTVCAGEEDNYDKGYSCRDENCLVFYYWSTGYYMCKDCMRVLRSNGLHDCKQYHTGCGAGKVNWCPCDRTGNPIGGVEI